MPKFYPTNNCNSYHPCPPRMKQEKVNCLEPVEKCHNIDLRQGESWSASYHLLLNPYLELKRINPGTAGLASFTISGVCSDVEAGDVLSLFNTCQLNCKSLEGCYTVSTVTENCTTKETEIVVAEEILPNCTDPIEIVSSGTFGFSHPMGCPKEDTYDNPPMLAKVLPNLDTAEVIGKITNSVTKRTKEIEVWANSGYDFIYVCPNIVQCYDMISVPTLGITDAQAVNVTTDKSGYQKVTLQALDGTPFVVNTTGSCVKGEVSDGVISHFQYTPICDGLIVSLPAESVTDQVTGDYIRGTEDFNCFDGCSEMSSCEPFEFAYYTIAIKYLTEEGVLNTQILANGKVYLTNTSLSI